MEPKTDKLPKFSKSDIVNAVANKCGVTKTAAKAMINATFEAISEALADGTGVAISDFGGFETRARVGRTGRNPRTGEPIEIDPTTNVVFKPAGALKTLINAVDASENMINAAD